MLDLVLVVEDIFSEVNWECPPWIIESGDVSDSEVTQELLRALCAIEFVFLKILQMAQESCSQ